MSLADPGSIVCPDCGERATLSADFCPTCQFPFICDVESAPPAYPEKRRRLLRIVAAAAIAIFAITQVLWYQYATLSDEYLGFTTKVREQVAPLPAGVASWLSIDGDRLFKERTLLTLGLIKARSAFYYDYISTRITAVTEIKGVTKLSVNNHPVELRPIGAMVESLTGKMWIKTKMAFGSSVTETWDWAVFNYAATLAHEAAHVELHREGKELGTVEEEVYCETQALDFLLRTGAPEFLIAQKKEYLRNPGARKYQSWYKWYHQFDTGKGK